MITLRSADGEERSMSAAAAKLSVVLSNMIEDDCAYNVVIPLERSATVARTLDTVIEYCVKHADEPVHDSNPSTAGGSSSVVVTAVPEDLEEWDRKLVEGLSADDLYDLLLAANHLSIQGLIDVVCQRAADMIKGKTTQQIRDTFNLPNDLTPADEAKLRQQRAWVID
nr:SKP1-like protein 1 [Setaria viridis]